WAAAISGQALGTWLGGTSQGHGCECSCHFEASPDEALIGLLKGQLDRCGPEHLHGQPAFAPDCPACAPCPPGHTGLEVVLALLLGLVLGAVLREALESLSIGCRVLAYYDRDDNYWHERYIIGKVTDTRFIVVTPHFDIYEEDFSESLALCLIGPRGGLPTKLNGHILRLDMDRFRRNEARLLGEGRQLAKEIREAEGLPEGPPGALADAAADGDAAQLPLPPPPGAPGAAQGGAARAGGAGKSVRWVAAEERAGYKPGDEVGLQQPEAVLGDRGVCELTDGTVLAVAKEGALESTATPRAAAEQDLRTLPVRYDARGVRVRDFTDAVDRMSSTAMPDWPIKGPRTTLWLVQQFKRLGQTPLQRHQWWRQTQNLTAADAGVDEHQFLSELLEMGAQTDQLNEGELAVYETVARRYQLWEEIYANRLRGHESGALRSSGSSAWLDEREIFLGQERGRGGALVCPELQTWVADRLQAEAAVLKERRKGREEKILARGVGPGGGDDDSGAPAKARRRQDQWLLEGIASLNELGGQGRQVPSHAPLTAAQRVAVRRLASLYGKWSPPVDRPSPHAAWSLLQGLRPGYSEAEAAGARTVYQRGNISLPKIGAGKVPLVDVLPADLQSKLESGHGLLRSPEEAAALIRDAGAPRAMDPKLGRLGYDYGHALGELFASGVIECSSEPVLEEAGMFFVARKDKRLRLICDTRTPNMHFTVPNHTALATGEALSSLEASGVNFIGMSSGDVDCCFYQYSLPPWCRRYFNLPTIQSRFLPLEVRNACGLSGKSGQVRFRFKVVPMGWNWAVHFIQEAHLHIVKSVLPSQPWCVDKHPGMDLSVEDAKVLYIDNFAVLSASPQRAAQAAYDMKAALAAKGVVSELDPQASEVGELLGCELDLRTGCWQVSGRRLWRLYGALEHLLSSRRVKVSGQELERLIGHIVAALMVRREGLALLHSSYEFVQASYTKRQPLWKSVLRELGWVKALLPASGVLATEGAPRERAFEHEVACAPDPALLLVGRAARFPEVSHSTLQSRTWRVVGCGRWKRKEAIHGLEGAALTWAVRRAGRDARQHGGDAAGKAADAGEPSEAAPPPLRPSRAELAQEPFALQPHGGAPDGAAAAGQWQPPYGPPAGAAAVALTSSPGPRGRHPGAGWAKEQTRLAAAKVRFATQQLYLGAVLGLVRWLCLGCLPDWSRQTWDETLAEYIESIYDRGGSKASTQRLAPALLWAEPHLHTAGIREVFPLTHQTLRGWGVLEPSKSRPPVPYLVMLAVVLPLPEEGGASAFLTFVVRASEYEVPTKTNEYDLSVPLDLQRQQWLVKPISFVQALREPDALFLGLSYTELAEDFQSAIEALDVGVLRPTLYSLRHGGASQDRSMGVRSLGGVQQRGGWKTFKSVLRYEKHGRLSLELRKLSSRQREALRAKGQDCALAFNKSL
ncbi:unnamed protein product, partial [Prorocentrum cordatum]